MMPRAQIEAAIRAMAAEHAIDADILIRQCEAESNFDQRARSGCGAIGLFQLMPATAKELRVDPADWKQNVAGGVKYMARLLVRYDGDYARALAAYNWGLGHLDRLLRDKPADWIQHLPAETRAYLHKILVHDARMLEVA